MALAAGWIANNQGDWKGSWLNLAAGMDIEMNHLERKGVGLKQTSHLSLPTSCHPRSDAKTCIC